MGSDCLMAARFLWGDNENVLPLYCGTGCITTSEKEKPLSQTKE